MTLLLLQHYNIICYRFFCFYLLRNKNPWARVYLAPKGI